MTLHIYVWSDPSLNLNHSVEIQAQIHVTSAQFCIFHVAYNAIKGKFSRYPSILRSLTGVVEYHL